MIKIVRFQAAQGSPRLGLLRGNTVHDLTAAGFSCLTALLESPNPADLLAALPLRQLSSVAVSKVRLLAPVAAQEVWAVGVTYLRSKKARMDESDFSATAYDRVYDAPRPELFFKSQPSKVSGPGGPVGIRKDARWNVPEPELALVFNSRGDLVGYTAGNDMSSRDIEGENLLYLPQAKIYRHSCALGPCLVLGRTEEQVRRWKISIEIRRRGRPVFLGRTAVSRIKRSFAELQDYLFRSQDFPTGAVLLTGTGVIPPDNFTLAAGDVVRIAIGDVGLLENTVVRV
jgi:2-dehydro-3-deoxy-D-arabinonate dehydratase